MTSNGVMDDNCLSLVWDWSWRILNQNMKNWSKVGIA